MLTQAFSSICRHYNNFWVLALRWVRQPTKFYHLIYKYTARAPEQTAPTITPRTEEFQAKPQKGRALGKQTPAKIMKEKRGINI